MTEQILSPGSGSIAPIWRVSGGGKITRQLWVRLSGGEVSAALHCFMLSSWHVYIPLVQSWLFLDSQHHVPELPAQGNPHAQASAHLRAGLCPFHSKHAHGRALVLRQCPAPCPHSGPGIVPPLIPHAAPWPCMTHIQHPVCPQCPALCLDTGAYPIPSLSGVNPTHRWRSGATCQGSTPYKKCVCCLRCPDTVQTKGCIGVQTGTNIGVQTGTPPRQSLALSGSAQTETLSYVPLGVGQRRLFEHPRSEMTPESCLEGPSPT